VCHGGGQRHLRGLRTPAEVVSCRSLTASHRTARRGARAGGVDDGAVPPSPTNVRPAPSSVDVGARSRPLGARSHVARQQARGEARRCPRKRQQLGRYFGIDGVASENRKLLGACCLSTTLLPKERTLQQQRTPSLGATPIGRSRVWGRVAGGRATRATSARAYRGRWSRRGTSARARARGGGGRRRGGGVSARSLQPTA
jgi:hypothetical protein